MIAVFIKGTWVRGLYAQRFNGTEGFCVRQGHDGLGIGLVVQPITDGEFDVVLATGVDNVLTLLRIHGHGLFTPHVLTSIGGNERKLSVGAGGGDHVNRSEEHTSELQSRGHLVCRLLLEKKKETQQSLL